MHAGSGFHNKLNLTSSKESCCRQDDVIYCLFIVWIFAAAFHKKPDHLVALKCKQLIGLWVYLMDLHSLTGEADRLEMLWFVLTFPSDVCA